MSLWQSADAARPGSRRSRPATTARVLPMLALLVALGTSAGLSTAWGQAPPAGPTPAKASPAPAAEKPAPASIPVPEVARRADDIGKQLRDFEALLVPGQAIEAIEKRLPEIAVQITSQTQAADRLLDEQPGAPTLDGLTAQWQTTRAELVGYVTVLAGRATAIEKALAHLTAQQKTWTQARADAQASRAPAQVVERIDSVLADMAGSRTRLQAQRAATLVLQDRAAQEVTRCEAVLERVAALQRGVAGRLLERDGVPLWEIGQLASAVTELPDRIRNAAAAGRTRLSLDPTLVRPLYVVGAFFLAELVRHFASTVPLLGQQVFLLEMLAGMVVLTWWLASRRRRGAADTITSRERALRPAARVVLVTFAAAFVVGAAGNMSLGLLLGSGVLGNGYLALVLYAGIRVADGLVAFALRVRPLCVLGMVQRHRPLLERRAHGLLRGLTIAGWAVFALKYFGLWGAAVELTEAALGAHLRRGSLSISLGDVLEFAVTAGAAILLSGLVRFVLEEDVYPRLQPGRGLAQALSSLLHYGLVLVGFLLALAALGVDLTKITILAGAFGVGIGFGLQTVVNNFVSGLLIVFERRIKVGDAVQIADVAGRVEQLGMRACTVRTWEGAEVIVPNASLIAEKVTNWTLSDRLRRIDVGVGVAYGTPPEKMLDILLAVARAHPLVLPNPAPVALFLGFGDSALRFELRAWINRFDLWVQTQSELAVALYTALGEAGFEIPFPQYEVRLRRA